MPQFWKWQPRLWGLQQNILTEQNRIQELRRYDEPVEEEEPPPEPTGQITPEEIRGRPEEVTPAEPREPRGWPWEWMGVTAWEYQKYVEQQKKPGELTLEELRAMPPPSFPDKPWGERIREYQELPFGEQMGYELPFWAATLFAPSATFLRASLLAKGTKPTQIVAAALKPVAAVEQAPAKAVEKVIKMLKKPPTPMQNPLPYLNPELTPYKARKQIKLVANELVGHLGAPIKKPPLVITKETMKLNAWNRVGEGTKGFVNRTYRVENILLRSDKYQDAGKMWQTVWKPIEEATNRQISRTHYRNDLFARELKLHNIDLGKWANKTVEIGGIKLTPFERIGVYLHSLNADNLVHIVFGNNIPARTVTKIVESLTPQEKAIAQYLTRYYTKQTPIMQATVRQVTGKVMKPVENYSPIQIQRGAMEMLDYNAYIVSEAQLRGVVRYASARIRKGFTLPRTHKALQPVELDALQIWEKHLQYTEHYKAFMPAITDLQRLLANGQFKHAFVNTQGRQSYQVLNQWLKQVAETNPLAPRTTFEAYAKTFRVNAVTAVLGVNIVTALKQFPSFFAGAAEVGGLQVMRGLSTFVKHPKETMKLIRMHAPQIYYRRFERELAEIAARRGLAGKMTKREVFMIMTTSMDRLAVNSIWRGGFDDALRRGMAVKEAAEYATRAIRRTQPYFGIKDVPEFWRAGELAKALTIFTNQLNQYWNYYRFHIYGKAMAGQISRRQVVERVIETFIVPALTIGAITRSRPAQDVKELATDLTSMGLATVPILGNWVVSGIRGFTSSGLITTEFLDEIRKLAYQANKGEWGKVALGLPVAGGYMLGYPVAQPRRFIEAFWEIAQSKTDDWLKLIWGTYVRGKVEEEEPRVPYTLPTE